jgi:metal-responsive CopG/Arc/MetJ family transcriptional regulator
MKQKISVSLDKKTVDKLDKILEKTNGRFRNRSHILEKAAELLVEQIEHEE